MTVRGPRRIAPPGRLGRWRHGRAGFTLMEVLVATGISTAVVVAAYSALRGGVTTYERVNAVGVETQVVRSLAGRLTTELQAVYFDPEAADVVFEGEEPDESADEGASRLTFATTAGAGPLTEVEYYLVEPDAEEDEPGGLYRRATLLLDRQVSDVLYERTEDSEDADSALLAPEVVGFEVTYYDAEAALSTGSLGLGSTLSDEDEWETTWDAASKGYLPQATCVTLYIGDWPESGTAVNRESDDGQARRVVLVVPLPLAEVSSETDGDEQAGGG